LYFDCDGCRAVVDGLDVMFGPRIRYNFNAPYRLPNPGEFWDRWHISLSTVMRHCR
jgi:alginate O-acetyltransferase complex protein AlgI